MNWRMRTLAIAAGLLWSDHVLAAGPAPIRPDIVGQIVSVAPPPASTVRVTHAGRVRAARPYQPLYPGDVVKVARAGVSATVVIAGGAGLGTVLTRASPPFTAPAWAGGNASPNAFAAFLANWRFIFAPNASSMVVSTTPRSIEYHPSPYLPLSEQTVRSGERQSLLVVWRGSRGVVSIKDGAGGTLARTISASPGFAVLTCPALEPGTYALEAGSLSFPLRAAPEPEPTGTPLVRALTAANDLRGLAGHQLQALADLQSLSSQVYVARALVEAVTKHAATDTKSTNLPARPPPMITHNPDGTFTIQKEPPKGAQNVNAQKGLVIPPQVVVPLFRPR